MQLLQGASRLNTFQADRANHSDHSQMCLQDLLEFWVKNCEAAYEKLASALHAIGEGNLASTLCQNYGEFNMYTIILFLITQALFSMAMRLYTACRC